MVRCAKGPLNITLLRFFFFLIDQYLVLGKVNDMKFLRNSVFVVGMSTLYGVSAGFKGKISSGQLSVKKIKTVGKNVKDFLLTYLLLVM